MRTAARRLVVLAALVGCALACPAARAQEATAPAAEVAMAERFPLSSTWQGVIEGAGPGRLFVHVAAEAPASEGADPSITLVAPGAGILRGGARGAKLVGDTLSFSLVARGVEGRFRGKATADGARFIGTLSLDAGTGEPAEAPFALERTVDPSTVADAARWEGTLEVGGQRLPMSFLIAEWSLEGGLRGRSATLDIPAQNLDRFPVILRGDEKALEIVLPVGVDATLKLEPKEEGVLAGTFSQGPFSGPIELRRAAAGSGVVVARPQMPKPPFPYRSREVTIPHRFGHSLAGTLLLPERTPESPALFPAAVLVSGSGPQDRDETLFGHKPFLVIADALARAGIAVLRYDDRGVGASTGRFEGTTTHEFATDADEATEWLRRQPEIDPARIGIIGHSEGGLIAPLVAMWQWEGGDPAKAISFVVLIAGPGVSGRELLPLQMRRVSEASGVDAASAEAIAAKGTALIDALLAENPDMEAARGLARQLVEAQTAALTAATGATMTDAEREAAVSQAIASLNSTWMRTFLAHDPRPIIAALRIPILAMNGTLDTQVDADQNLGALEVAAREGGAPLTTMRLEGLNHMLQPASSGGIDEYATIETTVDPEALRMMVEWIRSQVGVAPAPAK